MSDSDGKQKRGIYIVNPVIREFLNLYSPKGNEHFIKNQLYPGLRCGYLVFPFCINKLGTFIVNPIIREFEFI